MEPVIKQLMQVEDIYETLQLFDTDFVPSLSERGLDLKDYAQKLFEFAIVYTLSNAYQICGFVVFYANDTSQNSAYLAQIAVKSKVCNQGIGFTLLKLAMETSKERGMKTMKLEVYNQNHIAIDFYKRQGFTFCSHHSDDFSQMQREL